MLVFELGGKGRGGNRDALLDVVDVGAEALDYTYAFVPEALTTLAVVHVGEAETTVGDLDENLIAFKRVSVRGR